MHRWSISIVKLFGIFPLLSIESRVGKRNKKTRLLLVVRTIGPAVPRDDITIGGNEMSAEVHLVTGTKKLVSYAGVSAADEDNNPIVLAAVTAVPDNADMVSCTPGPDALSYWVSDNPTTGVGETPLTETFTASDGSTFEQRGGFAMVHEGPINSVGDPAIGDAVDRDA